jgi:hypothetical protein
MVLEQLLRRLRRLIDDYFARLVSLHLLGPNDSALLGNPALRPHATTSARNDLL